MILSPPEPVSRTSPTPTATLSTSTEVLPSTTLITFTTASSPREYNKDDIELLSFGEQDVVSMLPPVVSDKKESSFDATLCTLDNVITSE